MTRVSRNNTIRDNWNDSWRVYETKDTKHGFILYIGRPILPGVNLNRTGGNRPIITREFFDYMESIRYDRGACDLPIGKSSIKRIRKILGHNIYLDIRDWWEQHADELASMTETAFAEKHGYAVSRVSIANKAMFGNRNRPPAWWKEEPSASLLLSRTPRAAVADKLGISIGAVGRLRWALRVERGLNVDS